MLGAGLTRWSRLRSAVLGEELLAELREDFVEGVLSLPLGTVERAGTGDLLTRTTSDVDALSKTVRLAVPEVLVALITVVLVAAAMVLVAPLASASALLAVPVVVAGARWYLRRAPEGYLAERAASSLFNSRVAESVEAGRTVETLGRQQQRIALAEADLAHTWRCERYTLRLRCVFFPSCEVSYVVPVVATLVTSGLLALSGHGTLAQVTAITLYAQQLVDPVDTLLGWLDELQVGLTCFARLLGVRDVPDDRSISGEVPDSERLRREVSLVTQEHHVFAGTVADNLRLALPTATDDELLVALAAVDWDGTPLETALGAGGLALTPAQAQQLALARLVLADPHTLVLDEATALLDPRAARHLERSLSAVLQGRTVVAIAHRLHTASDADRVAVVEGGRVVKLGTHDELVTAGASYAALWRSWHGQP